MGQVTLYLDVDTEAKLREAAKAAGISQSQWVARLIRERTSSQWPDSVSRLAGAWADFPTAEELRSGEVEDLPREPI